MIPILAKPKAARPGISAAASQSIRFYGTGNNDIDRFKVLVNNTAIEANIGNTDITVEFWIRTTAGNTANPINAQADTTWTLGNIIYDRDQFAQVPGHGISLGDGRVAFGLDTVNGARTIVGLSDVRNSAWHHIAATRVFSSGAMTLYVDGARESLNAGPTGNLQYPNGAVPQNLCGPSGNQPCTFSDPYLVCGAEKHDADPSFPSFFGYFTELRLSTVIRYTGASFAVPTARFVNDASTAALYHFFEGAGSVVADDSGNGNPGFLSIGGPSNGPTWETLSPFP